MEQSKSVKIKIGNFSFNMYETEVDAIFCKSKVGKRCYDTKYPKSHFMSSFTCDYGRFCLFNKQSVYLNDYFMEYINNDNIHYILPLEGYSSIFTTLKEKLTMCTEGISLVNEIIKNEFSDYDVIFDKKKPDETYFFNKNTEKIYEVYFNEFDKMILHYTGLDEYGRKCTYDYDYIECENNYDDIVKKINYITEHY